MIAPGSTVLNGYTFTPGPMTAFSPTKHSSPRTTPSSPRTPARRSQERPTVAPAQAHGLAEVGVVVDDDPLEVGVGADPDVGAEHRVRPEPDARPRRGSCRRSRRGRRPWPRDGSRPPRPRRPRRPSGSRGCRRGPAVEHVLVRGQVALEGADVLPVALGDGAEERLAGVEQRREDLARRSRPARPGSMWSKISGSSTKMPVLIVSLKTWPQVGFSRKRSMEPSSRVMTIPNSSGFSTGTRPIVASASLARRGP